MTFLLLSILGCTLMLCGSIESVLAQSLTKNNGAAGMAKYVLGLSISVLAIILSAL